MVDESPVHRYYVDTLKRACFGGAARVGMKVEAKNDEVSGTPHPPILFALLPKESYCPGWQEMP